MNDSMSRVAAFWDVVARAFPNIRVHAISIVFACAAHTSRARAEAACLDIGTRVFLNLQT